MREGQINSLRQAEELFESAKTNPHHLELSKYLIHNMNSIGVALKKIGFVVLMNMILSMPLSM